MEIAREEMGTAASIVLDTVQYTRIWIRGVTTVRQLPKPLGHESAFSSQFYLGLGTKPVNIKSVRDGSKSLLVKSESSSDRYVGVLGSNRDEGNSTELSSLI